MLFYDLANSACVIYSHKKSATIKVTLNFNISKTYATVIAVPSVTVVSVPMPLRFARRALMLAASTA